MMGQLSRGQERLFYSFNLEDHIPANHLLRSIDKCLDLSDLRHYLADFYSPIGRPSIDPETESLDGLLSEHQQAFQTHTQAQLNTLNYTNRVAHPESNERLFEQLSGLADAQQSTEALAATRAEHLLETLSTQAETLGQQTLQALNMHSQTLEGQLNDHHQAFQLDTQTQLKALSEANQSVHREGNDQLLEQLQQLGKEHTKRLEALIAVLASKGRASVEQAIAQQDQRVQVTLCTQAVQASTQHESTLQTLAAIHQHLLTQDARVDDLQVNLQRTAGHTKALLYTVVPVGLLSLGALAYLILHIG